MRMVLARTNKVFESRATLREPEKHAQEVPVAESTPLWQVLVATWPVRTRAEHLCVATLSLFLLAQILYVS